MKNMVYPIHTPNYKQNKKNVTIVPMVFPLPSTPGSANIASANSMIFLGFKFLASAKSNINVAQ